MPSADIRFHACTFRHKILTLKSFVYSSHRNILLSFHSFTPSAIHHQNWNSFHNAFQYFGSKGIWCAGSRSLSLLFSRSLTLSYVGTTYTEVLGSGDITPISMLGRLSKILHWRNVSMEPTLLIMLQVWVLVVKLTPRVILWVPPCMTVKLATQWLCRSLPSMHP